MVLDVMKIWQILTTHGFSARCSGLLQSLQDRSIHCLFV